MTAQKRKLRQPTRVEPQGPLGHLINDALLRRGRLGRDKAAVLINQAAASDGEPYTSYDRSSLRNWIGRWVVPRADTLRWIGQALDIPLPDLAAAASASEDQRFARKALPPSHGPTHPVDSDDVKRRAFLATLSTVAAAGLDIDRFAAIITGTRVDRGALDDIETLTTDLMRRAATVTPSSLLPAVRGHLQGLCQALVWTPAELAPRAHSVAGRTALLAGYLALQQERLEQADAYWSLADRFGDFAGNTRLRAALRVHQAWRWEDDHPRSIALLDHAESLLGPKPEPAAAIMVVATRADRHADASHADPAHASLAIRDLDSTQANLSRIRAAHDDLYVFRSVTSQARNYYANALVGLGRHPDAALNLEHILVEIDPSALSLRSYITTDLAEAVAGMGDPEHACDIFTASLELAARACSPRCVRLLRDKQELWLTGYDGPAARRLQEQLDAVASAQTDTHLGPLAVTDRHDPFP
jgi:hypothetical protein